MCVVEGGEGGGENERGVKRRVLMGVAKGVGWR